MALASAVAVCIALVACDDRSDANKEIQADVGKTADVADQGKLATDVEKRADELKKAQALGDAASIEAAVERAKAAATEAAKANGWDVTAIERHFDNSLKISRQMRTAYEAAQKADRESDMQRIAETGAAASAAIEALMKTMGASGVMDEKAVDAAMQTAKAAVAEAAKAAGLDPAKMERHIEDYVKMLKSLQATATVTLPDPTTRKHDTYDIVLNLKNNETIEMNGRAISIDALKEELSKIAGRNPVPKALLRSDKKTGFSFTKQVLEACGAANIEKIAFSVVEENAVETSEKTSTEASK